MKQKTAKRYVSLRDCSAPPTCLEPSILISSVTVIVLWQQHLDREANWPLAEAALPSSSLLELSRHLQLSPPQFSASDLESSHTQVHLREVPPLGNTCRLGCNRGRGHHVQALASKLLLMRSPIGLTWSAPRCLLSGPKVYQRK